MIVNITNHSYQRNGVGGKCFNMVWFTTKRDGDTKGKTFFATVTEDQSFVMETNDVGAIIPDSKWRGTDYFHDAIRTALDNV